MLIVNSKQLPVNAGKDHELYSYANEYKAGIRDLEVRFPSGQIQLKRNGYPRMNKSQDGTPTLPEIPSPVFIKLTCSVDDAIWSYCKGRPVIEANGLMSVREEENSEVLNGEVLHFDLKNKPDYVFYLMYKSGLLGSVYSVYEPEADKLRELETKNSRIKVTSLIWNDLPEDKLRMVCQAWGVKDSGKKNILLLKEEIENKVFAMESIKQKDTSNLMLKGIAEFIAETKADEITRPKAIIQHAVDEGRLVFNNSRFYFDGNEVCYVPPDRHDTRMEYIAAFLRNSDNKEKWDTILRALITQDYVNKMDKYGKRWLASQSGVALNQKEEDLTKALLEAFPL